MVKLSVLLCFFVAFATAVNCATHHNAPALAPGPAPVADCSSLIYDMADCLSYVTNGSHDTKPQGSCCSGLKTVLKTDAECVCEAFKASPSLGIELNITKALTLPAACGVSAAPISNCGLSLTPGPAPAQPPKASAPGKSPPQKPSPSPAPPPPATVVTPAPAPSAPIGSGNTGSAPAQAPAGSGASASVAISFVALIASLVVASCSYF